MKKLIAIIIIFNIQLYAVDAIIIDVRTPQEYESGHIENSINIEWQDIKEVNNTLTKEQKIYLYCRSGNRSQKSTDILIKLGYKNVENIGSISDAADYLKLRIIK